MDYKFSQEKVINGTFGEMWLDNEYIAECQGLKAKIDLDKEKVAMPRNIIVGHKIMSAEGKGSITIKKISSRALRLLGDKIKNGEAMEFNIMSKLADPQSYGTERVYLSGVIFDDLDLINWERIKIVEQELPFTFASYDFEDLI